MQNNQEIIICNLSWNVAEEIQKETIEKIIMNKSFSPKSLIQPLDKSCWENAAKALKFMGFERVKTVTPDLLKWLQDINWPGAFIIIDLLTTFPNIFLLPYYEQAIIEAIRTEDEPWLDYLSIFTFCGKFVSGELSNELFNVMKMHEDQWATDG